jgi:PTS system nitrogen regulatory IIA component
LVIQVLNKFEELLKRGVICFIDDSEDQCSALSFLVNQLVEEEKLTCPEGFYQSLLQREKVVSTGIGMGIALPHAKMNGIEEFFLGIGIISGKGIPWGSIDGLNVRLIVLIGGPDGMHKEYLRNLSQITQFLKDEERRDQLVNARSIEDVVKIFETC